MWARAFTHTHIPAPACVHRCAHTLAKTNTCLHKQKIHTQHGLARCIAAWTWATKEMSRMCHMRMHVECPLLNPVAHLALHSAHATQYQHSTVQHSQSPLHLNCEVNMAWSINYVDLCVLPFAVSGCRLDGNPLLALQVHMVHLGPHPILAAHLSIRYDK